MSRTARHADELAYRERDGISVTLRWNRATGDISILVEDSELGESFVVPAQPEQALQVFQPPVRLRTQSAHAQGARNRARLKGDLTNMINPVVMALDRATPERMKIWVVSLGALTPARLALSYRVRDTPRRVAGSIGLM
jgi:hypothetical protein